MAAIRDFFRRKKADKKFKTAGAGHKLSEESLSSQKGGFFQRSSKQDSNVGVSRRANPTEGAQRAGAAALARIENLNKNRREPNWSLAAIRAQARKELDLELQAEKKEESSHPKEVFQETAPLLAVNGVYYSCPMIGPHVLPLKEMEAKIKEFLYDQLAEERGLTSCLIIRTCNKNKEKVKLAIETIQKYLRNIMENPKEEKYRKIRLQNKVFQEKVACVEGTYDFLLAAGFENMSIEDSEYLVFPEQNLGNLEYLEALLDALQTADPIIPELDRNTRILMPAQASVQISLPREFFNLSADEIRKEQEQKSQEVETITMLRTKAMRERDATKEFKRYRFTLLRIKFPDGIILQGTFSVLEKLSAVTEFIWDNLANPEQTFVLNGPGGEQLIEFDTSLLELHLVPAAILNLTFPDGSTKVDEAFLKTETMALLESL